MNEYRIKKIGVLEVEIMCSQLLSNIGGTPFGPPADLSPTYACEF